MIDSKSRSKRVKQIMEILECFTDGLTARQVAEYLKYRGCVPTVDLNASRPRLTELEQNGVLIVDRKERDPITGIFVSVYRLPRTGECGTDISDDQVKFMI